MADKKLIDDFLKPSVREIKKTIRDIDDSYNNDWDILAELCQNSIDAIRQSDEEIGEIYLEIDSLNKRILIRDNGIGIEPDRLPSLLAPFSTNKENDENCIGEKGVGLTFVMFSCNDFMIKSGTKNGCSVARVKDAYYWKQSTDDNPLILNFEKINDDFIGTEITLNNVHDIPIFELRFEQIKFILRTRTAIGNTKTIWENDKEVKIMLNFKNLDGDVFEEELPFKYWLIFDDLNKNSKINLDDFIEFAREPNRTDQDKRRKLKDKIIYKKGEFVHSGRTIKYITCFVPKRRVWDDLSVKNNLCTYDDLKNDDWLDKFGYVKFQPGIFTSVKGMPTGISVEHPSTGYAGYWSNIFILFEDRHLKFDIGRKSIHGMQARIYKKYAREIFNEYLKFITKYVSGEIITDSEWDKDEIFAEIENIPDLNIKDIKLKKTPKDQEASVAALFFECIGNGKITDIDPLISGYRNKYDLYAKWGNKKVVIEFKSRLRNILRDFNDEQKMFNEIDCIVCWDVSEEDYEEMKKRGLEIEKIAPSELGANTNDFPNATHQLILSAYVHPIYIIDLKEVIK